MEKKGEPFVSRCFNEGDPITLEEWSDESSKQDVITILPDPTERKNADKGQCYERSSLMSALDTSVIWHWVPSHPSEPMYGRADKNIPYYKLPLTNQWITQSGYNSLKNHVFKVFQVEKLGKDLIGSEFGVSRLHGAEAVIHDVRALAVDWKSWKLIRMHPTWPQRVSALERMRQQRALQWERIEMQALRRYEQYARQRQRDVRVAEAKRMPAEVQPIPADWSPPARLCNLPGWPQYGPVREGAPCRCESDGPQGIVKMIRLPDTRAGSGEILVPKCFVGHPDQYPTLYRRAFVDEMKSRIAALERKEPELKVKAAVRVQGRLARAAVAPDLDFRRGLELARGLEISRERAKRYRAEVIAPQTLTFLELQRAELLAQERAIADIAPDYIPRLYF